ncbi:hypothetical protein [Dechloromonas sp. H13]|uniref:hypothetical protein n=1 Tax=Dechloromonas sp. H13 TaxID=2570193 RepID=UPI0012909C91|nr:hypothetical protein [Dechloromonas sp. H13]
MSSPILARADALMRRRRTTSAEIDDVPLLTDALDPDDEIPLLLDAEPRTSFPATPPESEPEVAAAVVPASEHASQPDLAPASEPAAAALAFEGEMLDIVAHELARRVSERLAAELPGIIESTVRDFLAEPEILALIQPRD